MSMPHQYRVQDFSNRSGNQQVILENTTGKNPKTKKRNVSPIFLTIYFIYLFLFYIYIFFDHVQIIYTICNYYCIRSVRGGSGEQEKKVDNFVIHIEMLKKHCLPYV